MHGAVVQELPVQAAFPKRGDGGESGQRLRGAVPQHDDAARIHDEQPVLDLVKEVGEGDLGED